MRRPCPRPGATAGSGTLGMLLLACVVVACTAPEISPPAPTVEETDDQLTAPPDPARDELVAVLEQVATTVERARAELDEAAGGTQLTQTRQRADAALGALLDDPATTAGDQRSLFPAVSVERSASGDEDDLLNGALSLAREVGGALGRDVVELLREPVAGDLGAWERDAEGVVAELEDLTASVTGVEDATEAIGALAGDGTRAVAWTLLAATSTDQQLAAAAAERAGGHLAVVSVALSLLETAGSPPGPPADSDGDADAPANATVGATPGAGP